MISMFMLKYQPESEKKNANRKFISEQIKKLDIWSDIDFISYPFNIYASTDMTFSVFHDNGLIYLP